MHGLHTLIRFYVKKQLFCKKCDFRKIFFAKHLHYAFICVIFGLLLIIFHALYIFAFITLQGRIDWIHQHPPTSLNKIQAKQREQTADTWLRWIAGPAFLFSILSLIGLTYYFASHSAGYAIPVPLTLFLLYILLIASGLNSLLQNYLHFLMF